MPWRLKKLVLLILMGVIVVALAVVVWILNQSVSSDILAAVGVVGGLAIIVNSLPSNGGKE